MTDKPAPRRRWRTVGVTAVLLLSVGSAVLFGYRTLTTQSDAEPVSLSQVMTAVTNKQVKDATITAATSGSKVVITLTDGSEQTAYYPAGYADTLTTALLANNVTTTTAPPPADNSWIVNALMSLLPMLLIVGILIWIANRSLAGGIGGFKGGRGTKLGEVPTTRFADIAGADEAVADLTELVEFLKDDSAFIALGATAPRGALLVGPPGTGKTLLARAVAGEAGVPFYPIAGSDFVEVFAGAGARRVRDLFDRARAEEHAIIFIDEVDAVGRSRSDGLGGPSDSERDNTLIALLNEIDGFTSTGVIVIAATNRPDLLDGALTRPGRIERQVQVPLPDRGGREAILAVHVKDRPVADDLHLAHYARRTPGFSGAELAQLVNEAAIVAAKSRHTRIETTDMDEALATIALGRARTSALVTDTDRSITAHHEAAHALVALLLPAADDPVAVSIVPRGAAGGVTWMGGNDDIFLTKSAASARLAGLLAGQCAEKLLLDGDYTSGASSDLLAATKLAHHMVASYGMGERLAVVDDALLASGGHVADQTEAAVEQLLQKAAATATDVLMRHRAALEALAAGLLDQETLDGDQIRAIVDATQNDTAPATPSR